MVREHATPEEIATAREHYACDEIEVDDDAYVSRVAPEPDEATGGYWVSAWVWIEPVTKDDGPVGMEEG